MNPNHNQSNEQPGLSLPAPYFEAGKQIDNPEKPLSRPIASPEKSSTPPQPTSPIASPVIDDSVINVKDPKALTDDSSLSVSPGSQLVASPSKADDLDLIEKEWVVKAKQIVESTKEDPYVQTKEMNNFKADYVKKRYNKDLKLAEE